MLTAIAVAILPVRIKELVYGNVQQGDDLVKGVQARVLSPVLKIHNGTRGTVYELCKVFLCPAFCLSFALDFPAQSVEVKPSGVLVHSHITPISFYISGVIMRTKHNLCFSSISLSL